MKPDEIYTWAVHLKNEELEELIGSSVVLDYKKNDVIIKQGSLATQILVLEEGMVKLNFENYCERKGHCT